MSNRSLVKSFIDPAIEKLASSPLHVGLVVFLSFSLSAINDAFEHVSGLEASFKHCLLGVFANNLQLILSCVIFCLV